MTDVIKDKRRKNNRRRTARRDTDAPPVVTSLLPTPEVPGEMFLPFAASLPRGTIFAQIHEERRRQNAQWGGAHHDNAHSRRVWIGLIREHGDRAAKLARSRSGSAGDSFRHRLVVIAALAVAAIEAHDRKEGQ